MELQERTEKVLAVLGNYPPHLFIPETQKLQKISKQEELNEVHKAISQKLMASFAVCFKTWGTEACRKIGINAAWINILKAKEPNALAFESSYFKQRSPLQFLGDFTQAFNDVSNISTTPLDGLFLMIPSHDDAAPPY